MDGLDISSIRSRSGKFVDATNFRYDLNLSGSIDATDIQMMRSRSGNTLP